jgi:hypothetical protein
MARVETVFFFQNGTGRYFRVGLESICIDVRAAGESSACCGVNLAFAVLGGGGVFIGKLWTRGLIPHSVFPQAVKWGSDRRRRAMAIGAV